MASITLVLGVLTPAAGRADEPRSVNEPRLLAEPGELMQVVDAFDDNDVFDLHLSAGFQTSWKTANILRETSISQPGFSTGGFAASNLNVARFKETTSRLNTRADIGLFRDLALVIRMPIILSNQRELNDLEGSAAQQSVVLQGLPGEQLFRLPFKSPKRSGIEYLAVGLDAALMSQARDLSKPTWIVGIEGRFNVSEPMHACNDSPTPLNAASASQQKCAHPSDVNRNGVDGEGAGEENQPLEGTFRGERDAGVSRGVTGLELHTYLSRRIKYVEPYAGFRALFEFQTSGSDYGTSSLKGSLVNHPPLQGTVLFGLNVFPWEIRDRFQRVALDFRFTGTYVSEGRDYSELFDALGSSDAPSLRQPNYAEYRRNPLYEGDPLGLPRSVVATDSRRVYVTGITDVQQYGIYTLSSSFTWQAGEYVKFNVGGAVTVAQEHFITFDQACNPDFSGSLDTAGTCVSVSRPRAAPQPSGIPNPNYRKVINDPGHRFKVDDSLQVDAWLNATVMF
ncbi:MAG TPA: hypothetical protein VER33_24450 [Polyangiaceae bacterium]|nr:hypothetical protein [Polyangiaceae bacterium]